MADRQVNGAALRAMRLRASMTTKDLAQKSGLSESTIEGIEAGRRKYLADHTLIGLAKGFGVDPMALEAEILHPVPAPGEREADAKHPAV